MAKIKQGFLGNASGKLGNVVFSKWRDKQTARQYQPDVHDAKTPAQIKQRNRMVALLQFLKPLNKNFIKFFNSDIAKGSTPWAVAIKNNMKAVSADGCFSLNEFQLGDPKYPAPELLEVSYNPFIDLTTIKYSAKGMPSKNYPFPYIGTSVLAEYKTASANHEFDLRHIINYQPVGSFFCSFYGGGHEHVFENWWGGGRLWLMYYDTYDIDRHFDPNNGLTFPVSFKPVSIIQGFNTDVKDDIAPLESISWEYQTKESGKQLVFNIDLKKTQIKNPKDFSIVFWAVSLSNGATKQIEATQWDLSNRQFSSPLDDTLANGTFIILYSVFKKSGEQVSCFNRFYIDKNSVGKEFPYFWQLFDCWYANPTSFILEGNQCGFCGSVDELFSDFIQLFEQGIIHNGDEPAPVTEYMLRMGEDPNGKVEITGFTREEGGIHYFTDKSKAILILHPNGGYGFSAWVGVDSDDVVASKEGSYELSMIKDRSLSPVFKVLV